MGLLRIILAIAVVVAHVSPFFGLRFFGGGVMAVECFFMLSGFYMALVLEKRYRGKFGPFYFNRFLRLFPVYWMLLAIFLIVSCSYWMIIGHPLGALANWRETNKPLDMLWAGISNFTIVGCDVANLLHHATSGASEGGANRLLFIPATWSLSVEMVFYAIAPWLLRLNKNQQMCCFCITILIRYAIWSLVGRHWSPWLYYFPPASWVFFLGGVFSHHLMVQLQAKHWFMLHARKIGVLLAFGLTGLIATYIQIDIFDAQDWRFYTCFGLALPFVFYTFKDSKLDALIGSWSYPLYLGHAVVMGLYAPLRHFVPEFMQVYVVLAASAILTVFVQFLDNKVQAHFKRLV